MYIIHEYLINGYTVEILDIISAISILCGIFVIISKNPIVSVLYLIGLFLSIASYLIFIGINFIGLSYLLVYVGAVSILFLFILMLINVRISELTSYTNNSLPLGVLIVIALNISICNILPSYNMLSNNFIDLNNVLNTFLYNNVFNKFSVYILNTKGNKQDNIIYLISNTI
jgi:NADH-ubiquinone oxidoreductase chain 6